MKRFLFALMTFAVLSACNNNVYTISETLADSEDTLSNDNVCVINGTLTVSVDSVSLVDLSGAVVDVAAVKDGMFTLKCDIDPEGRVSIIRVVLPSNYGSFAGTGGGYSPIVLIPDVKNISVTITDDDPVFSGSPLTKELYDFKNLAFTMYWENVEKVNELMDDTLGGGLQQKMEIYKQLVDSYREAYQTHKSDAIGVEALNFMIDMVDDDEFIALYEQGGKAVKAVFGEYYEQLKSPSEESIIRLPENDEIDEIDGGFWDFVGNGYYTLVDFWASWCGPCRAETPNVIAVYEKYHDQGLQVIGVPVNDKREAIEQALKDLGIHYPQVLDPSMELAKRFNVVGIPYILLFDPDGNIVAADLRGAQIEEAVREVLP